MIGAILGSIFMPPFVLGSKRTAVFLLGAGLLAALGMSVIPVGTAALIYAGSFINGFLRSGVIAVMMARLCVQKAAPGMRALQADLRLQWN